MNKRPVEVAVISDVHLGTYGCHANELLNYLNSIQPTLLILNGDFIDIWNFNKRYFPAAHLQVIKAILDLMTQGTRVIYITGNHDEMLRRYSDLQMGLLQIVDKMVMEIDGRMCWIFHGDVFDATTRGSARILAKLGGKGYDLLILLNRFINWTLHRFGQEKMSLSRRIKNSVKKAVSWISNFEQTAAELAIEQKYDYVICGHIHQPQHRTVKTAKGEVQYLNSGDWVENLTSLEYHDKQWVIYTYNEKDFEKIKFNKSKPEVDVISHEVMVFINKMAV